MVQGLPRSRVLAELGVHLRLGAESQRFHMGVCEPAGQIQRAIEPGQRAARIRPEMSDSRVDFPQPEGPMTETNSPAFTAREMSPTAHGAPPGPLFRPGYWNDT